MRILSFLCMYALCVLIVVPGAPRVVPSLAWHAMLYHLVRRTVAHTPLAIIRVSVLREMLYC